MKDERRLHVLRAIVEDFIATREPVGSQALVERHDLQVSSATVRNDMASLEEEGYIVQPHTSAGRIPTDKGYRMFVDRLADVRPMTRGERTAIQTFLDSAQDLDSVLDRTVRVLSQLTNQVALVQYPRIRRSRVRHVELVSLPGNGLLMVLIADTGRVWQQVLQPGAPVDLTIVSELRARINAAVVDRDVAQIEDLLGALEGGFEPQHRPLVQQVRAALLESADDEINDRVVMAGAANLARYGGELTDSLHAILESLDEHVTLLRLLGETTATDTVNVRIGSENDVAVMDSLSVVTSGYGPTARAVAHIGVVGPMRMDYAQNMAAVLAVARYLSRIVGNQ